MKFAIGVKTHNLGDRFASSIVTAFPSAFVSFDPKDDHDKACPNLIPGAAAFVKTIVQASPKIMTGELALARHVPCAAIRHREPGSNSPLGAALIAATYTQANLTLAIVTFGRTKRDRSEKENSSRFESLKLKRALTRAIHVWG
ncbi:MAG TPA: hypothetical protein VEK31_04690 [Xanthobacteraceae bacterium]|nr:hypothetical protein [Xanthobacteraceae bacterium]